MYAIVDIAGKQYKVAKNQKIFVHRIEGDLGASVDFDQVLLIENEKEVIIGEPVIEGALISGKILSHTKGDKVKVFKKKKRKGYKVLRGHRQLFTEVEIENIQEKGAKKARPEAKAAPKTGAKAATATGAKAGTGEKAATAKPKAKTTDATKAAPKKPAAKAAAKPSAAKSTPSRSATAKPKAAAGKTADKKTGGPGKSAGASKKPASGSKDKKEG